MSGKKLTGLCLLFGILLAKGPASRTPHQPLPDEEHTIWDGNNISNVHGNHGDFVSYHLSGEAGLEWPKGEDTRAVFQSGLWIAAGIVNGVDDLRVSVAEYSTQFVPGEIDGNDGHIYRMHKAEIDAFLNNDWATFSSMTLLLPETIVEGANAYTQLTETSLPTADFMNWPVDMGAPWIDGNGDGVYNPPDGDYPDIKGDMYHWYVMNEADSVSHAQYWEGDYMNLDVRVAMYGFNLQGPFSNTQFMEWDITNAGSDTLDSMFVSYWSDADVGSHSDDYVGMDTTSMFIYSYNAVYDAAYGSTPPAVGTTILQTPAVPSTGDTAFVDGNMLIDHRNVPIYSGIWYGGGISTYSDPNTAIEVYRYMNGLIGNTGDEYMDPEGNPSRFVYTGNPYTGEGWIDSWLTDKRQLITTGPFKMYPGDTVELAAATHIAQGMSNLQSVAALLAEVPLVIAAWKTQFSNMIAYPEISNLSNPPDNTESTGPFDFSFSIMDTTGFWSGNRTLHYTIDSINTVYSTELVQDSGFVYSATVDGWAGMVGDHIFKYYVEVLSADTMNAFWPSGAPYNYMTFIFGPDTTAPVILESDSLADIHYLLPLNKQVAVTAYDQRFGLGEVAFNWQVNSGAVSTTQLEFVELIPTGEPLDYFEQWRGEIEIFTGALGDTITYWFTASDTSNGANVAETARNYMIAGNVVIIGNWEMEDVQDWQLGPFCSLSEFNVENFALWDRVISLNIPASSDATADTLTYLRALDLSNIGQLWLRTPMIFAREDAGHRRIIELSTDGNNWQILDEVDWPTMSAYYANYALHDFAGEESIYVRYRGIRGDGSLDWYLDDILLHSDSTLLSIDDELIIPKKFTLHQNYPNPFNPVTTIRYDLPIQTEAKLTIYNVLGQEVNILLNQTMNAGSHAIKWNAANISSGIYFYRLETPEKQITKKLVVLK